MTEMNMISRLF